MEPEEAKERVLQRLESDLTSADLQWSLFIAALESYRHDSILRPFPSAYVVGDGNKNFQGLVSVGHLKIWVQLYFTFQSWTFRFPLIPSPLLLFSLPLFLHPFLLSAPLTTVSDGLKNFKASLKKLWPSFNTYTQKLFGKDGYSLVNCGTSL